MKHLTKRILSVLLIFVLVCSVLVPAKVQAADRKIFTTPTGYDSADDVDYQTTNGIIHNWGARGEDCIFLSTYAIQFYTGSNTYDVLSDLTGSSTQNSVPSSDLYKALQTLMKSAHTHQTTYGDTRYQYCYTDCVSNDTSKISSFYSGGMFNSTWDSGATWNREHTWPASKSLSGRPSNGTAGEGADIMMLRPTLKTENGSRGNKAYGESSGFHDPGVDVRGDCARIVLYTYIRWGNYSNMWGSDGVIENQNVLLKWMEEDPVDTWEMGRNDSVQSITGTRNVFVDYPELAYILFGREVPSDITTPSGEAKDSTSTPACTHSKTEIRNQKDATCTADGYTGDTYCKDCGDKISSGSKITASGHVNANGDAACDVCGTAMACAHSKTEIRDQKDATCTEDGYTGDTYCKNCGDKISSGSVIGASGHKNADGNATCDVCGASLTCSHGQTEIRNAKDATCTEDGYTGDTYCKICGDKVSSGKKVSAAGHKNTDGNTTCDVCGTSLTCPHDQTEIRNAKEATCAEEGYTGDTYCTTCGDKVSSGEAIGTTEHNAQVENAKDATCTEEGYTGDVVCHTCQTCILPGETTAATGNHNYGQWMDNADGTQGRMCADCGFVELKNAQTTPSATEPAGNNAEAGTNSTVIFVVVGAVVGAAAIAVVIILVLKKKKK